MKVDGFYLLRLLEQSLKDLAIPFQKETVDMYEEKRIMLSIWQNHLPLKLRRLIKYFGNHGEFLYIFSASEHSFVFNLEHPLTEQKLKRLIDLIRILKEAKK